MRRWQATNASVNSAEQTLSCRRKIVICGSVGGLRRCPFKRLKVSSWYSWLPPGFARHGRRKLEVASGHRWREMESDAVPRLGEMWRVSEMAGSGAGEFRGHTHSGSKVRLQTSSETPGYS